ncbi:MAG: carboxypeptidase-like regulatory domain-containing protein [Bacteroidota bacterium]
MKLSIRLLILLFFNAMYSQNIQVLDSTNNLPIPFATISFGNGLGNFADDEGWFSFSKEKYRDVDTLYISSLGYAEKAIMAHPLPRKIYLTPAIWELNEVVVSTSKLGKFKLKKQKAITHEDIFASWLPTIESEVAIFFERYDNKITQISKLILPINAESKYKSRGRGNYATICRIQFYENKNGLPGSAIGHEKIVFSIDEKQRKVYELDIASKGIFIPQTGIYASLQVLGYANAQGRLIQSKKYHEVETPRGIEKVSTSFRPLLPFSNRLAPKHTYVRRVFFNDKKWQIFDRTYNKNSKLVQTGHTNYGMGAFFRVYGE